MQENEKITEYKEYHKNPRHITEERKGELEKNMLALGDLSGIVHDLNTNEIISGNQRSKIIKLDECEVEITTTYEKPTAQGTVKMGFVIWRGQRFNYRAVRWDDKQREKANITANALTGYWSHDILLNEWQDVDLLEWGLPKDEFTALNNSKKKEEKYGSLTDKFIVPPFSVLDTKRDYWLQRKNEWLNITGNLSETRDGEFGRVSSGETVFDSINEGTSNFDPVLAELIMKWFCVDNGKILDPFGGEQTKGVVAGALDFEYKAVEFRKDQVILNNSKTAKYKKVKYFTGDSNNISKIIKDRDFDLCFTSPPYYDLEIYSKEDMSALGTYEEFMKQYKNIFSQCYDMLADDSFLVVKICEIRNKKTGIYRNFVGDNIKLFMDLGFKYYNEIILLNSIGTAAFRASNAMRNRKVVKIHQNVLVFYKGNENNIGKKFKTLDIGNEE